MGSLDLVKKFFAMDPGNKHQHWSLMARVIPRGETVRRTLTQDESPQVRLQTLELVCVILQLFLCNPPGVAVRVVR